jgi:glycosyltransferase involved in cell wall biosynthesis
MSAAFRNEFCFLGKREPIGEELERKEFRVYYLPLTSLWNIPMAMLRLYRLLRADRYDILHLYGLKANFLGRVLGSLSEHKRILGGLKSKYPSGTKKNWTLWLDRLTFGLSLGYVSNSQAAIDFLTAHGYDRRKFWLIHNGIDIEPFYERSEAEKDAIKREYELPFNKPIITSVANLRPPKGHEYLIQALHELKRENPDFLTLLVGDGPLRGKLEELVRDLGLKEQVHFLGSRDREDIPEILAITDIFVLPSLWEGLPTAIIEAMAAGCPVVATAVAGTPEVVMDRETGFLVNSRDPEALAQKIAKLLEDPQLRRKMGEAGVKRVEEHFTLEKMAQNYEALYRNLMTR